MTVSPLTWSSERVAQLKRCFDAGLTCSQIAREIGVTRNAVIGKMSRMGLSRPREMLADQFQRTAKLARPKRPRGWKRLAILAQRKVLMAAFPDVCADDIPIHNGRGCTLLELGHGRCRWPINEPGTEDFCYCGNEAFEGLPYCPGHARLAYRAPGRPNV